MTLGAGDRLGTFEIVGPLGSGAMGEVYRARDLKLTREVAIKLLTEPFARDADRLTRFEREARLLASLNHPGIAQLYQFEQIEGSHFLVMELVEGATLEERLALGPLPVNEALSIFAQIAEALEAAHERGIIHRDLKPANIKITEEGRVKVLDFGLAKAFQPASPEAGHGETLPYESGGAPEVSRTGQRIGTPAYMSPEQARGHECDHTSDIWAFGVCFYEALTGRRPFGGQTTSDLFADILKAEPDWEALPPETPGHIRSLLRRCLEKMARRRPRDIGDLAITLLDTVTSTDSQSSSAASSGSRPGADSSARSQTLLTAGAVVAALIALLFVGVQWRRSLREQPLAGAPADSLSAIRSMVVLPFANSAGDPEQEYFVEGMRDALSAELSKIGIRTISRSSAMRYKDTRMGMAEIAKELNVDALIEGSVFRKGNDIRVVAGLIHGASENQLWGDTYLDTFENMLELQGRMALAIAREIELKLAPDQERRLAAERPFDPRLHDIYLQGVFLRQRWTLESANESIRHFERAIEINPDYALAHAGLAEAYSGMSDYFFPPQEVMPPAKAAALRALEIDDTLVGAHVTLGRVFLFYDWDWSAAERAYQRALELDPGSSRAHAGHAQYLTAMLQREEALAEVRRALELDPFSSHTIDMVGMALYMGRHFEELEEVFPGKIAIAPDIFPAYNWLGLAYAELGRMEEAVRMLTQAVELDRNSLNLAFLGGVRARSGDPQKAREVFAAFDELRAQGKFVCPYEVATVHIALGEYDEAFGWLETAYETQSDCIPWLRADVRLDPVRADPRFEALVKKVNFPPS